MPLIPDDRPLTSAKPAKSALIRGIIVAVLLHFIVVMAYLVATGNIGRRVAAEIPDAAPVSIEPKPTVEIAKPQTIKPKAPNDTQAGGGSDQGTVKLIADSDPPPEAGNVEKRPEIRPVKQESRSRTDADQQASPVAPGPAARPQRMSNSASRQKIPDAWIQREKARLEKDLKYYENLYWRRVKGVVSLKEKEELMRPVNETKAKLQRLQAAPEAYFGLSKEY